MASRSSSGATKEEREDFLRAQGYTQARTGKGSHQIWENHEMKTLCRSKNISMPENLRSNAVQNPWEVTLPCDPASGTWRAIKKQAEWASHTVSEITDSSQKDAAQCEIVRQFHAALEEVCAWKKSVKHALRMGQDAPKAPESYRQMTALKTRFE